MQSPEERPDAYPDRPLTASERLKATTSRARAELSADEAARMRGLLTKELREWEIEFDDLTRAYHRMLYVAAVLDEPLSVREFRYLLIARWKSNTDEASLRKRVALGVQQNELKWRRGDRYTLTPDGVNHLAQIGGRIQERKLGLPRRPRQAERPRWAGGRDDRDRSGPRSSDGFRSGGNRGDRRDYPDRRERGGPPRPYRDRDGDRGSQGPRRDYSR